jgi:hypothetical protein
MGVYRVNKVKNNEDLNQNIGSKDREEEMGLRNKEKVSKPTSRFSHVTVSNI